MAEENNSTGAAPSFETTVLFLSVFIVGLCTIVFELLIGSVSSYFLGDSVKQFSLTIGFTMTAMGLGTLLSRSIKSNLIAWFIYIELALGLVGGLSVPLLFGAYTQTNIYYPVMMLLITAIGTLIGLEIPLLTRIMEQHYALRLNISNVLSLDYFGALAATLLFPFFLLPFFGIFKSSLITGMANIFVGLLNLWAFREYLGYATVRKLKLQVGVIGFSLIAVLLFANSLIHAWESNMYEDRVIFSKQSQYQKIVLTKMRDDLRLYLDGNLQFSSVDEYRYHEPLVHIPLSMALKKENILFLGGGDGLAVREALKHDNVKKITLVDLDTAVTNLALQHPLLRKLNKESLADDKVEIINMDAFKYLEEQNRYFDVIIADLPDPKNNSLARLYSREYFSLVRHRLARNGIFITQATSPYFATKAFWCIKKTVKAAGFRDVRPFHVYVPSFGDWGFVLASAGKLPDIRLSPDIQARFLDEKLLQKLFVFSRDLQTEEINHNTLNKPVLLTYYHEGWRNWD